MVKCEIVVPIFVKKNLVAELDIESYFVGTFTKSERDFVEACATVVGKYLAKGFRRRSPPDWGAESSAGEAATRAGADLLLHEFPMIASHNQCCASGRIGAEC
jgi:hypothetical protein